MEIPVRFMKKILFTLLLLSASSLMRLGAQDVTISALQDAVKANPNSFEAHFNLGVAYFNGRQYDLAAPEFKRALDLRSGDAQSKEMFESSLGIGAYLKGDYATAIPHLKAVLAVNPKNPNANMLLGNAYVQTNDYKSAEAFFLGYLAAFPDKAEVAKDAHEGLAKIYMDEKNYAEAAKHLTLLVAALSKSQEPDRYFGACQNLGVAYFQSKDYADAVDAWNKAVKVHDDAQIEKFLGYSYYNLGQFPDAIAAYQKSIQLNPGDSETYFNLAVAYNDNGLYDEAASAFAQAFKIDPKDSNAAVGQAQATEAAINAHLQKGSNLSLNGQTSEAIAEWQKVLAYAPDNKQAQGLIADAQSKLAVDVEKHYEAGQAAYRNGKSMTALNEWNSALKMDPTNAKVQAALNKLKVKNSEKVAALLSDGDELYAEKDYAGALDKYRQAAQVNPDSAAVKKALKKLKTTQGDAFDNYYTDGKAREKKGDFKKAIADYETASSIDPSNADVKQKLFAARKNLSNRINQLLDEGSALMDKGDKDQASQKFQQVLALDPENVKANDYITKMTGQTSQQKANSENVKALYYEGVNLYLDNKITDAVAKWKQCLVLDPGNVNAQQNIAKAEAKLASIKKLSGS
ncbi:MAG TPA: tetratricopeptide repeat protein [bacterium]|nr:tetratricopeptide repeat protein [bacterium]